MIQRGVRGSKGGGGGGDRIKSAENLVIAININRIPLINEDLVFLYKLLILLLLLSNKLSNKSFGNRTSSYRVSGDLSLRSSRHNFCDIGFLLSIEIVGSRYNADEIMREEEKKLSTGELAKV
ncbi:hypothetical protein PCH_Pc22g10420 [Penicillium rubens Wisconsin 54-1255]|uniref:Uncharacterized protein n=1 Tax=Penicillium rubens (strain ATCC 28089 / DSM 1075 / NRRL 1951 / Wisconsin 54-1255) TaxID=500485 RepID=B6HVL3_PENRW|nr:hypothetical protein PCH_Pc22g10420 [Penicillium rubens Wisconsin 54-1255]